MDWNSRYLNNDTPWDKGSPAPPLVEAVENGLDLRGHVVLPGCGVGHDARFLAEAFPAAAIRGVDISEEALRRANAYKSPVNLTLELRDFLADPWDEKVDTIVEHTCFCAIHPDQREAYAQAAVRALEPGGILIGVFFIAENPDLEDGPPYFSSKEQLRSHFSQFEVLETRIPARHYPGREGEEELWILQLAADR